MQQSETSADVFFSRFKNSRCEKDETVSENRFFERSTMPAIHCAFTTESAETVTIFQNNVVKLLLQVFTRYAPKRNDGSNVKWIVLSIASLDSWREILVLCLVEREDLGEHTQKE